MVTKEYFDDLQKEMANKSVESLVEEFNQQLVIQAGLPFVVFMTLFSLTRSLLKAWMCLLYMMAVTSLLSVK